jgi:hypothetical protein
LGTAARQSRLPCPNRAQPYLRSPVETPTRACIDTERSRDLSNRIRFRVQMGPMRNANLFCVLSLALFVMAHEARLLQTINDGCVPIFCAFALRTSLRVKRMIRCLGGPDGIPGGPDETDRLGNQLHKPIQPMKACTPS